jgi:hypothetical protein
VHVLGQPADESFISLNLSEKLAFVLFHRGAQAVIHEPSGFLSHANMFRQLNGRNALAGIGEQVNGDKPFLERQFGFAENSPGYDSKILLALGAAIPLAIRKLMNVGMTAMGAILAVAEPDRSKMVPAGLLVFEVFNEFG